MPRVILFGGDIPDSDMDRITSAIKGKAAETVFVKVSKLDVLKAGDLGPHPDVNATVYRKKIGKEL